MAISLPGPVVVFIILLIWLLLPEGDFQGGAPNITDIALQQLARHRDSLATLNTTRWGDFSPTSGTDADGVVHRYLNLTGFREKDGFAWEELDHFLNKGRHLSRHATSLVHDKVQNDDDVQGEAVWANASGTLRGDWIRRETSVPRTHQSYNLSQLAPYFDWVEDRVDWARNITGSSGRMLVRLDDDDTVVPYEQAAAAGSPLVETTVRGIKATVTLEDAASLGHTWDMVLWGVHWPKQGLIMMTTTSEKFDGIFGLPHLTPGPEYFQSSKQLLNESIPAVIDKKEQNLYSDQDLPWSSDLENSLYTMHPSPHCEYIMYAQVHPPARQDLGLAPVDGAQQPLQEIIQAIEDELEAPVGAPVPRAPELQVSAVLYSPDCAFYIETKGPPDFPPGEASHLLGMKSEIHIYHVKIWLLLYAAAMLAQAYLLKAQMTESYTPSNMGRVSFTTASIMSIADGMTFTAAATWVSSAKSTLLPTLALVIAAFQSMALGGEFMSRVLKVQLPEHNNRRGRDQSPPGDTNPNDASPGAGSLQRPASSSNAGRRGRSNAERSSTVLPLSQPVIVPSDQDVDAEIAEVAAAPPQSAATPSAAIPPLSAAQAFQGIVGRYIMLGLCIGFLAISSSTWYASLRSLFLNLCAFSYMSLWVPQIHRNVIRNCRRALSWHFVIGQSVLRMLPIAYFWTYPSNFVFAQLDVLAFGVLCGWVWLQIFVLAVQDVVGPRFCVPSSWVPDAWDYHRVLREDNIEAGGLPLGLAADETPGLERSSREMGRSSLHAIDCTICREILEVPVVKTGEEDSGVATIFTRKAYMVTPCRHIFHSVCLENWMRFRLQCPICREDLPPL
ncbi:hypothetical protein S40285_04919 [Stachybotrys chlorohalonatus IBT 40285]|uniref:DSC E3 ubiquitin ligase complex subunit A n=1 Tax=Stachybotrys chlorohalonatus (strain IBT 40285) TaxID=1283841 RepID=A0A084QGX5_STAC4|nr:hypothetical protein S40285_04919 [Stachybotrys chlorohalonata IBT 40285]